MPSGPPPHKPLTQMHWPPFVGHHDVPSMSSDETTVTQDDTSPSPERMAMEASPGRQSLLAAFPQVSLLHLKREALLSLFIQHLLPGTHLLLPYPELEPQPPRHRQRSWEQKVWSCQPSPLPKHLHFSLFYRHWDSTCPMVIPPFL